MLISNSYCKVTMNRQSYIFRSSRSRFCMQFNNFINNKFKAGFGVLDTWEITSQRPDASEDGLHFGECKRQRQELYAEEDMGQQDTLGSTQQQSKDINRGCIYRIINQMFFNMVCDVKATG